MQESDLPAAVADGPVTAETLTRSEVGKLRDHCRLTGWLPEAAVNVRFNAAVPPTVVEPDDSAKDPNCPKAGVLNNEDKEKAIAVNFSRTRMPTVI